MSRESTSHTTEMRSRERSLRAHGSEIRPPIELAPRTSKELRARSNEQTNEREALRRALSGTITLEPERKFSWIRATPRIVGYVFIPWAAATFASWYYSFPWYKAFVDSVYGGAIDAFTNWVVTNLSAEVLTTALAGGAVALLKIVIPVLLVVAGFAVAYRIIKWMTKGKSILPPMNITS